MGMGIGLRGMAQANAGRKCAYRPMWESARTCANEPHSQKEEEEGGPSISTGLFMPLRYKTTAGA